MDEVGKQQQVNQSHPQISQDQIKANSFPELVNHSSKQTPVFHGSDEERQQIVKNAHVEKQLEDNVQVKTQKPEQLGEQIIDNENNEGNGHQEIEKQPLQKNDKTIEQANETILNIGNQIKKESNDNQQNQVKIIFKQNEDIHQKSIQDISPPQVQQIKQIQIKHPQKINQHTQKIQQIQKHPNQQEEKQKNRYNTEFVESSFNDKEKPVIEFEQYNENIINPNQQNLEIPIDKPPQQQSNKKQELQPILKLNEDKRQSQPQFNKSIQNSPRKEGAGKIARKKLHEKGIYNALINLQKRDKKQKQIYELAQKRQQSTAKIDLSKLQTNITLNSNVLNVIVIEPQYQKTQQQKLLLQVQQLRKRLLHIQLSRNRQKEESSASNKSISALYTNQQYTHLENLSHQESSEGDYYISSKHDRKRNIGKFYRLVENNNAKISEQLRILGFRGKSECQKQTFSARKPRTNSFRVRKNNKSNYQSNQKDYSIEQIPQNDECFQVKREATEKLFFDEDDKLNFIEKPIPRKLIFDQNFKQYIQSFFIPNIIQKPFQNDSEAQLVQLAKNTFNKFGVNLKQDKSKVLHIRKYKNCVSFILDSQHTIIWHYEGRFYLGGWQIDQNGDGHKVGWGYQNSPNKFTYTGQFKDNKRDGYGIMRIFIKKNEIVYEGQWKQGAKHGLGKQLQVDSSIYIGEWENGKKQGHGKMIVSESEEYEGQFRNGLKWGKGKQKFKNKDSYVGEYAQGKFHGKGIYNWCNFSRYQGSFIEGRRCGHGIWTIDYRDPQADSYQGQYLNDKKHGFGKYHWKDGTTYEGEFKNDLKHGEGVITQPSGRLVRFDWIQGNIITNRASLEIDESEAVTSINKNQPFKKQQQKNPQRSIKALKMSLKGSRKSNAFIST